MSEPTRDTVLVTGSSRGIGRSIALRLARDGYDVVVHYHKDRAAADEVVRGVAEHGATPRLLQFDTADRAACESALLADIAANGAYYGVVCNAGITSDNAFPALTAEQWDRVIHTNLDGFFNVLHPVIMPMVRRRRLGESSRSRRCPD